MAKVKDREILGTALYGVAGRKIHRAVKYYRNGHYTGVLVMCFDRQPNGHSFMKLGQRQPTCLDCGPWRDGIEAETEREWDDGRY